jgi:AraC-like DNA-binding protein
MANITTRGGSNQGLATLAVPARNAKMLLEQAQGLGIDPNELRAGTEFDEATLATPGGRISYGDHITLHRNLLKHSVPEDFAFTGGGFSIASYGMLGYAMMSSATLNQAIQIAVKYYRTAGPLCGLFFDWHSDGLSITAENTFDLEAAPLRLVIEEIFSTFPALLRLLVGGEVPARHVDFSYPQPAHLLRYRETFNCPMRFDQPVCRFEIDASALALPLVQADADSAVLFERSCRELLAEIDRDDSLTNQVRHFLLASPGNLVNADRAARHFRMGARTLRRRLAMEQTSYQSILDEVRRRIAIDYLSTTALSTQEIAELLGFSEATNFRRAFLRWTERTPASYRGRV